MIVVIPRSRKALDLQHDPRVVVQTPVTRADDLGDEFKVRGHVVSVDEAQRRATVRAVEAASGWRPERTWTYRSVWIESVAHVSWQGGDMVLTRWDPDRGVRGPQRRRLDMQLGGYELVRA